MASVNIFPYFSGVAGSVEDPKFLEIVTRGYVIDPGCQPIPVTQVFNYAKTGDGTDVIVPLSIADQVVDAYSTNLSPRLSDAYVGLEATYRVMDDPWSPAELSTEEIDAGGVEGDRMPSFGAITLRASTSARGRHFRSNKHMGPVAEAGTTADKIEATDLENWENAVGAFYTAIDELTDDNGNIFHLVVLSRSLCQLQTLPTLFTGCAIEGYSVNPLITTMRRRRVKKLLVDCPDPA